MRYIFTATLLSLAWIAAFCDYQECPTEADILYVVDASASIQKDDYDRMREKLADLVKRDIGDLDIKSAFLQYGTFIEVIADFDDEVDADDIVLDHLYHDGGQSKTHEALEYARGFFQEERGGRPHALRFIVLITDGHHTNKQETILLAEELMNEGYTLAGFGVGPSVNMDGITRMTSPDYAFDCSNIEDFQGSGNRFIGLIEDRVMLLCGECTDEVDMLVMLDVSASITESVFDDLIKKIGELVDLPFEGLNMDFALMQFSTEPQEIYPFSEAEMPAGWAARHRYYFLGQTSYVHRALFDARQYYLPSGRTSALKYVVIFSDGSHENYQASVYEANRLKENDVTVVAFGVGRGLDMGGMEAIASDGLAHDATDLNTLNKKFAELSTAMQERVFTGCQLENCPYKVDALVMIDVSASIEESKFDKLIKIIAELVKLEFGEMSMDYAVLQFSTTPTDIMHFTDEYPTSEIIKRWVYYEGHQSNTHTALQQSNAFLNQGRVDALKFVFFYSDGVHTDVAAAKTAADALKADGVTIVGIAVGQDVDVAGIELISSPGMTIDASILHTLNELNYDIEEIVVDQVRSNC